MIHSWYIFDVCDVQWFQSCPNICFIFKESMMKSDLYFYKSNVKTIYTPIDNI